MAEADGNGRKGKSTTTRIETHHNDIDGRNRETVAKENPLQQGLKHCTFFFRLFFYRCRKGKSTTTRIETKMPG